MSQRIQLTAWLALLAAMLCLGPPQLAASTTWPSLMNFQGHLTNNSGNAVADGTYPMTFAIYTQASSGSNIWSETQNNVSVTKGLFDVVLGSVTSLSSISGTSYTADLWLGVSVNGDPEMTPRQQLLTAPYAHNAQFLMGDTTGTAANNIVVLDGTGKIPAGLIQSGSLSVPTTLAGSASGFALAVTNTNATAGTEGIMVEGASGIYAQATSASGNAIWGLSSGPDNSNSVAIYASAVNGVGIEASSTAGSAISATTASSLTTVAGVVGVGATGVLGWADNNSGRAVDGEVSTLFPGAIAVRGSNASVTGTAVFGIHQGTGAGIGVRGGSASGIGAMGVYGSVSGSTAIGTSGFSSAADGNGVVGWQGNASPVSYVAGVVGKAFNQSTGIGVRAEGGTAIYGLSNGPYTFFGLNNSTSSVAYGVNTQIQSSVAGSAAGYFAASGTLGQTYGVEASNASSSGYSIYADGGADGVHSAAGPGGNNFNSDDSNGALYGFYHYDNAPQSSNGVGVYVNENCPNCKAGYFANLSATVGGGMAVEIDGRLTVRDSAGTFTVTSANSSGYTAYTLSNNFIQSNSLLFLTPVTAFSDGNAHNAVVVGEGTGSATIQFIPPLLNDTTYQFLVIGQ